MRKSLKQQRRFEKLQQELGPDLLAYLSDPAIIEIHLNADGRLWIRTHEEFKDTSIFMDPLQSRELIGSVADHYGLVANHAAPLLEAEIPESGYRFVAFLPPVVTAPAFSIRKPSTQIFTLDDYRHQNVITSHQIEVLRGGIHANESILIAGGPGTGKTTFANALLNEMVALGHPYQRFILIEDIRELKCTAPNTLPLKTADFINHHTLFIKTLRASPDRLIIGECRGSEMATVLQAWNTGTKGGLATIHANTARSALMRVNDMAQESDIPSSPRLIVESIGFVVSLTSHAKSGRQVNEVLQVLDYKDDDYVLQKC